MLVDFIFQLPLKQVTNERKAWINVFKVGNLEQRSGRTLNVAFTPVPQVWTEAVCGGHLTKILFVVSSSNSSGPSCKKKKPNIQ